MRPSPPPAPLAFLHLSPRGGGQRRSERGDGVRRRPRGEGATVSKRRVFRGDNIDLGAARELPGIRGAETAYDTAAALAPLPSTAIGAERSVLGTTGAIPREANILPRIAVRHNPIVSPGAATHAAASSGKLLLHAGCFAVLGERRPCTRRPDERGVVLFRYVAAAAKMALTHAVARKQKETETPFSRSFGPQDVRCLCKSACRPIF